MAKQVVVVAIALIIGILATLAVYPYIAPYVQAVRDRSGANLLSQYLSPLPSCEGDDVKAAVARVFVENSYNFNPHAGGVMLGWSDVTKTAPILIPEREVVAALSIEFHGERAIKKEADIRKITCSGFVTANFDPKKIIVKYDRVWFNKLLGNKHKDSWDQSVTEVIFKPIEDIIVRTDPRAQQQAKSCAGMGCFLVGSFVPAPWQIVYSAQYTDDGQLYIEIPQ